MSKVFGLKFGAGNPQTNAGLSPTLFFFRAIGISTYPGGVTDMVGPTIAELGVSSGFYTFNFAPSATFAVFFVADGGTGLAGADRFVSGVLDPIQAVDEKVGTNQDDIGNGASMTDPLTIMAITKRLYAFTEGQAVFAKGSGVWSVFAKGSTILSMGASTLLMTKQLTNTVSQATKT